MWLFLMFVLFWGFLGGLSFFGLGFSFGVLGGCFCLWVFLFLGFLFFLGEFGGGSVTAHKYSPLLSSSCVVFPRTRPIPSFPKRGNY